MVINGGLKRFTGKLAHLFQAEECDDPSNERHATRDNLREPMNGDLAKQVELTSLQPDKAIGTGTRGKECYCRRRWGTVQLDAGGIHR